MRKIILFIILFFDVFTKIIKLNIFTIAHSYSDNIKLNINTLYDSNIFTGLSMIAEYNDSDYKKAKKVILASLIVFSVLLFFDLVVQIIGITYNFYRLNAINISLKIFELFLLLLFFLDSWHYLTLFYIFGFTQLICSSFEIYSIIFSLCSTFKKYNKIRNFEVKSKY